MALRLLALVPAIVLGPGCHAPLPAPSGPGGPARMELVLKRVP